ncbi:hypothetical protein [Nonomuraea guangzhouensis]|uniref:WXG100 family type VII secretion target n=1 Tax=Nonomuraea guangzhouensis TaxID=1291555 RepID=A0ABW4GCP5_9ACTN|nr:hypothetical protein [Nonomuraea guangzhouensis]
MGDGIRIEPAVLIAGGKACDEAVALLRPAVDTFRTSAAPTSDCFGLIERGSDELAASYQAFWNARIEGKSWGQTFGDVALFSGIAGGFNGAVGRAFNPAAGQRGVPSPQWFRSVSNQLSDPVPDVVSGKGIAHRGRVA